MLDSCLCPCCWSCLGWLPAPHQVIFLWSTSNNNTLTYKRLEAEVLAQLKAYIHRGREGVSGKGNWAVTFGIFKSLSIRLVSKQRTAVLTFINDTCSSWLILNYCHIWSSVSISGLPSTRQSGIYRSRSSHACVWAPGRVVTYGQPRQWGRGDG